jgi:hypothetical protein
MSRHDLPLADVVVLLTVVDLSAVSCEACVIRVISDLHLCRLRMSRLGSLVLATDSVSVYRLSLNNVTDASHYNMFFFYKPKCMIESKYSP